jgi:hypothetical protein
MVRVCDDKCKFSNTCTLKSGASCEWRDGDNFNCCNTNSWQFCNSATCNWFSCAACTSQQTGCLAEC